MKNEVIMMMWMFMGRILQQVTLVIIGDKHPLLIFIKLKYINEATF